MKPRRLRDHGKPVREPRPDFGWVYTVNLPGDGRTVEEIRERIAAMDVRYRPFAFRVQPTPRPWWKRWWR